MVAIYYVDGRSHHSGPSVMALKHILYEATMEVLESLGEETMQALIWQLNSSGVNLAIDEFDLQIFAVQLRELLGDGAESILEEIYQNIVCRIELIDESAPISDSFDHAKGQTRSLGALQKIQGIFGEDKKDDVR
jgi:hypothetical protein